MSPKAVLFDLDGTLVESIPDIAEALNELLAEEGRPIRTPAEVRRMVGEGVHRLVEKAFGNTGRLGVLADRFLALYTPRSTRLTVPIAGVVEVLDALRAAGLPMAVCTNKPDEASRTILGDLGLLPYFATVIGGSCGFPCKPDPAVLLEAARRLKVAPADCLMVGDALPDVAAARAASVLRDGYGEIAAGDLGADGIIEGFGDLLGHWVRLPEPAPGSPVQGRHFA
jgi:phosphoglycolate phosphatase